jgi:hypothetical protein
MAERSHVTSFEAIESFRANLIIFLNKARPTVEEASNEILRMKFWLENDQRHFWQKEIRMLGRQLEDAQQELFAARLSKLQNASAVQEMAVQRLRRRLRDAEDKQQATKKWSRELEDRTAPLVKEVAGLHTFLTVDVMRAVAYLAQVVKALDAYAGVAAPGLSTGNAPEPGKRPQTPATGSGDKTVREGEHS